MFLFTGIVILVTVFIVALAVASTSRNQPRTTDKRIVQKYAAGSTETYKSNPLVKTKKKDLVSSQRSAIKGAQPREYAMPFDIDTVSSVKKSQQDIHSDDSRYGGGSSGGGGASRSYDYDSNSNRNSYSEPSAHSYSGSSGSASSYDNSSSYSSSSSSSSSYDSGSSYSSSSSSSSSSSFD